jgi:hypothetical protein
MRAMACIVRLRRAGYVSLAMGCQRPLSAGPFDASLEVMRSSGLTSTPDLVGEAGYVSPYPYLDRLQEKMEERLARRVPATGRFCGFCYARLQPDTASCPFCQHNVEAAGTVNEIPQPVLRMYKLKRDTEARWVYGMGFVGLIIAAVLFVVCELWGPGIIGHPAFGFAVLLLGGYVLAQFFGTLIGAQFGYRNGARKRDRLWAKYMTERDRPAA